jgi:expansin (peptidoglycan-binding protein)
MSGKNGEGGVTIRPRKLYLVFPFLPLPSLFLAGCIASPTQVILQCPSSPAIHHGQATYYYATGAGACSFDSSPAQLSYASMRDAARRQKIDTMIGAMNVFDYAGSQMCGASVVVSGPNGTITIRIVDLCPECPAGNIDLSPQAFEQIADTSLGRVPISWYVTASNVTGPILYHFMDASSKYWTAVQIRNHRYPIYSIEYLSSSKTWRNIDRTDYNYFVVPGGLGIGPYTFRVTDIYGHVLVDSSVVLTPGGDVAGSAQFPPCNN